ncbi:hypothetical protein CPB83DRAFT_847573 [Crepidotus variabilis]|uniref:Transmembrane protein n=1 Tax=Crepidotus variabilis TaxID=179855 RepID=A0A9P6JTU4_9AGAR|nr:hypothetical protein CPB83DRAFT_847573 [Crepidotus variabilis]
MSFQRSYSDATLNNVKNVESNTEDLNMQTTSNNLVTRNAFLIFRLVFLALLTNLAFLSIIFASWNVHAAVLAGFSTPTTSVFVVLQCCLVFICVVIAILSFFYPGTGLSRIIVECVWVGGLSMLAMGSAISASMNGFAVACQAAEMNICASASLLMPLTWLSSVLTSSYFMALFVTSIAHRSIYPDIWKRSVYEIEWFGQPVRLPSKGKVVEKFLQKDLESDSYVDLYGDIEGTADRRRRFIRESIVTDVSAPWAAQSVRRGVDLPFSRKPAGSDLSSSSSKRSTPILPALATAPPLSVPHRSATTAAMSTKSGSRFIERFRESTILTRQETPSQYVERFYAIQEDDASFPKAVVDMDQPIPLPRLSEWVRADGQKIPGTMTSHGPTGSRSKRF